MDTFSGLGVSRGISLGPVYRFKKAALVFDTYHPADRAAEWGRFEAAVDVTRLSLERIYDQAVDSVGTDEAAIFHAHIMILQDPELQAGVKTKILEDGINAEAALHTVTEEFCHLLEQLDSEYLRARSADIRDVRTSLLHTLLGIQEQAQENLDVPSIILSQDLTPSDCIALPRSLILGFVTVEGSATSHTAILARSLGIPALVGVPEAALHIPHGEFAILDGFQGVLVAAPDPQTVDSYTQTRLLKQQIQQEALGQAGLPAVTTDGRRVEVYANLGGDSQSDLEQAVQFGAEGVGLLRTEFIYLDCQEMPGEETQYQRYKAVLDVFAGKPVIIRTLDIGGDKQLPYLELPYELNPFLGVRGIRLSLRHLDLFRTQLRAMLRAAAGRRLQVMFPMVTKAAEIFEARTLLEACQAELRQEGAPLPDEIEVGIMVEIPAAAVMADSLAKVVDFFSIGTNDLSQYTLAVDRTNTSLADLANAFDPAVLRLVRFIVEAAHRCGKKVGVCGELGGDPLAIPILTGLGLDELSMNLPAVPVAKKIIRQLSQAEMARLAERALELETPREVQQLVLQELPFIQEWL